MRLDGSRILLAERRFSGFVMIELFKDAKETEKIATSLEDNDGV